MWRAALSIIVSSVVAASCASGPVPRTATSALPPVPQAVPEHVEVAWEDFTPEALARAKAEGRLILLSVYTQWCHWCHVMDEETWADPRVARLLRDRFVTLRVDADARPDVAERYREWAWPATAVLTPDARDVLRIKGFRAADKLLGALQKIVRDLDAGEEIALRELPPEPPLVDEGLAELRDRVVAQLDRYWDEEHAGWGGPKKYPLAAPLEHALFRAAREGDAARRAQATRTLEAQLNLLDPVWGGIYQYSTWSIWTRPHYEKLAVIQGWALREYAEGYRATGDARFLDAARGIHHYLNGQLRDGGGAYFANQDADVGTRGEHPHMKGADFYALDDEGRRAAGAPYVDRNVYAQHNGAVIAGLAQLYAAGRDGNVLADAESAFASLMSTHRAPDGGFVHAPGDDGALLHLGDQLGVLDAAMALLEVTGRARYGDEAEAVAATILARLYDDDAGGFFAHTEVPGASGVFAQRTKPFRDNARCARLLLRLSRLTGDARGAEAAQKTARFFARPAWLKEQRRLVGEYALLLEELVMEPVHVAVVGSAAASDEDLWSAALSIYAPGRLIERLPPGEKFPDIGEPAVYVCTETFCSRPFTDADELLKKAPSLIPGAR
jgi:uncharacterized protein YyaL (SSP411 family)